MESETYSSGDALLSSDNVLIIEVKLNCEEVSQVHDDINCVNDLSRMMAQIECANKVVRV